MQETIELYALKGTMVGHGGRINHSWTQGWRSSGGEAQLLEFDPCDPHQKREPAVVVHACNSRQEGHRPATLPGLFGVFQVKKRDPAGENQSGQTDKVI